MAETKKLDFVKLCIDSGADKAAEIPVARLSFEPSLRLLCEKNACGRYGRNLMCPPDIGDVSLLIDSLKQFSRAVIWQNIYELEDSFDYETMTEGKKKHREIAGRIAQFIYGELGRENALVLTAGGCDICPECAGITKGKCRNPEEALASLEAYGLNVSRIGEASGLKYINGQNTVTYFSGLFLR